MVFTSVGSSPPAMSSPNALPTRAIPASSAVPARPSSTPAALVAETRPWLACGHDAGDGLGMTGDAELFQRSDDADHHGVDGRIGDRAADVARRTEQAIEHLLDGEARTGHQFDDLAYRQADERAVVRGQVGQERDAVRRREMPGGNLCRHAIRHLLCRERAPAAQRRKLRCDGVRTDGPTVGHAEQHRHGLLRRQPIRRAHHGIECRHAGCDVELARLKERGERMAHRRLQTRRVVPGHGRQQRDLAGCQPMRNHVCVASTPAIASPTATLPASISSPSASPSAAAKSRESGNGFVYSRLIAAPAMKAAAAAPSASRRPGRQPAPR